MEPTTDTLDKPAAPDTAATPTTVPLIEEDLLVEEISIDGMCGVY
jgi:mycofactocin precursor